MNYLNLYGLLLLNYLNYFKYYFTIKFLFYYNFFIYYFYIHYMNTKQFQMIQNKIRILDFANYYFGSFYI